MPMGSSGSLATPGLWLQSRHARRNPARTQGSRNHADGVLENDGILRVRVTESPKRRAVVIAAELPRRPRDTNRGVDFLEHLAKKA